MWTKTVERGAVMTGTTAAVTLVAATLGNTSAPAASVNKSNNLNKVERITRLLFRELHPQFLTNITWGTRRPPVGEEMLDTLGG